MLNIQIILIIFLGILLLKQYNIFSSPLVLVKHIESWRDMPFIGTKDIIKYHQNLPIYYPISSPLNNNYHDYLNSITSPKLSFLRSIMRRTQLHLNQGSPLIIFNQMDIPINLLPPNKQKNLVLANTIINTINEFGKPLLKIHIETLMNEINEETETQSKICFDIKIKLYYADSEKLGKPLTFDILFIRSEFIFEKTYKKLIEDQFFSKKHIYNFKVFLSKLIILGAENMGVLPGRNNGRNNVRKIKFSPL